MLRKTVFLGILLILFVGLIDVQAQASIADWQYDRALESYEAGNCNNASSHITVAFDRYTALNDVVGISKSNELIKKINDCIVALGDSYYVQALDYFVKGETHMGSGNYVDARSQFDFSILYLQHSNLSYQHMLPIDRGRIDKINSKYSQVNGKIIETELRRADVLYAKSLEFIDKEDYLNALLYVDDASEICVKYDYESCIENCWILRKNILENIADMKERAKYLYEKGIEAYTTANCTNNGFFDALTQFTRAKDSYLLINDAAGTRNCEFIIDQTNAAILNCKDSMVNELDKLIHDVSTSLVLVTDCSEYEGIRERVIFSRDMAQELYDQFKLGVFKGKIGECDNLLTKIASEEAECLGLQNADEIYNNAYNLFTEADYEGSIVLVMQAKDIFEKMGDWGGVTKSERLIDILNEMIGVVNESDTLYNEAIKYYKVADYGNALSYVERAKAKYENISRIEEVVLCNSTIKDIIKGNKTKNKADGYYEEALKYITFREYGTAIESVETAKDLYKTINYVEGLEKADKLLTEIPPPKYDQPIIPALVIFSVLFIIFLWSRTKVEKVRAEKKSENEQKRMIEEKKEADVEAERKRRESEKEKMMMERKKLRDLLKQEREKETIKAGSEQDKSQSIKIKESIHEKQSIKIKESIHEKISSDKLRTEVRDKGSSNDDRLVEADTRFIEGSGKPVDGASFDDLIIQESESIKKEKKGISGRIEWESDKLGDIIEKGKTLVSREKKGVIADRDELREIIEGDEDVVSVGGEELDLPKSESIEQTEIAEMIKRERESLKKRDTKDDESVSDS